MLSNLPETCYVISSPLWSPLPFHHHTHITITISLCPVHVHWNSPWAHHVWIPTAPYFDHSPHWPPSPFPQEWVNVKFAASAPWPHTQLPMSSCQPLIHTHLLDRETGSMWNLPQAHHDHIPMSTSQSHHLHIHKTVGCRKIFLRWFKRQLFA